MSHDNIREFVRENVIEPEGSGKQVRIRLLDPVFLLHGKVRNAMDIEQNQPDRPRQDVKHAAMPALCVPRFLEDMRNQIADEMKRNETFGNYIQALNALKYNYSGRLFEARHPGIIRWTELIPPTARQLPFDRQIQSSLRHLDGEK